MENVSFQPSGEEIERALMDLGPLLGVTIKEEVQDELADPGAPPPATLNVASISDGAVAGGSGVAEGGSRAGSGSGGADSLASPSAARAPLAGARCVSCSAPLALTDGTPKLMECLHSACEPCVKAKIEEKQANATDFLGAERITISCPACRLQCQPANMIDQRFVLEKVALEQAGTNGGASGEQQCNSCEESDPATSYCTDCAEFICDNCVHAHQRLKITKDHTIKSKEEALASLQAAQSQTHSGNEMYCRAHPQERLALFCETCDRLTCRDCQLHHHRDHKYQFSTEMAAQARANISSLLSEVSYKRVLLGSAMKVIRDRQQLIADKKKSLVHEITQTVVKLTNAINTRGKQLVLRLNEVCDAKQRTLSEKKEALEQLAGITDHCVEFVTAALEQGSDTALLYSKRCVCAHLQRIKSRRADIPNPEIPVRISLALDKLPDLVRVLSSIGAIVVDGKVDGGAGGGGGGGGGGAQGPYHPPGPAPPATPPSSHSAVMALQHVAMHQSYVQSVSSAAGGGGGGGYLPLRHQLQARAHTPLRHPHVTSTTHPHHLHGVNELNLRGLLNAQSQAQAQQAGRGRAVHPPQHSAHNAMHHAYHQMIGAYANNAYAAAAASSAGGAGAGAGGRRSGGPRTPSPAPPAYPHLQHHAHPHQPHLAPHHHATTAAATTATAAKWHIPQHALSNGVVEASGMGGACGGGADFKITLGRQHPHHAPHHQLQLQHQNQRAGPSVVTSTNPKTPSPSLNGGVSSELDKVCAESVQDLMATIAKLDSNGVQVVAEQPLARAPSGPSPLPPSPSPGAPQPAPEPELEADLGLGHAALKPAPVPSPAPHVHSSTDAEKTTPAASGDPNEDWCAVCMDGGELMCCDKCPKVFHQYCHIPTIEKLPDETETWQCLLCVNFAEVGGDEDEGASGLSPRLQKIVERITLELYCQYEPSLAFREPVSLENTHYHAKIARPMCLDAIRMKLQPRAPLRYTHAAHFVADCRLLFRNAYTYNPPDSQIYKDAKRLEEFFDAQLVKWLPEYAYWSGDGDPPHLPNKRPRLD